MANLYVVATPIGNLEDLSARALRVLREVEVIAAEDTRHTRKLLSAHGITTRVTAYHDHNESEVAPALVDRVLAGESVALVSDAGTPLLADPGYRLVERAVNAGATVVPIPGPSAITAALAGAGLPTDRFCFEGFLPAKAAGRRAALASLAREPRTIVLFEAPHRVEHLLIDVVAELGETRRVVLARELTKQYEQFWRGTATGALEALENGEVPARGEFVVLIAGAARDASPADEEQLRVMRILLRELPPGTAASLASEILGSARKPLYDIALALKKE